MSFNFNEEPEYKVFYSDGGYNNVVTDMGSDFDKAYEKYRELKHEFKYVRLEKNGKVLLSTYDEG